jgi:hypothetical protein
MTDAPNCRYCGAPLTRNLVDLGMQPLANSYVPMELAGIADTYYPLHARVCDHCLLVQVDDVVPAEEIFNERYAYFSSFSESWLAHCRRFVEDVTTRYGIGPDSLVIEIASNDGYLLQYFVQKGIPVLGVEPSANTAAEAEKKGVPTRVDFFGRKLAQELKAEGRRPTLICAANVLAHVPDIRDFVAGVSLLLEGEAVHTVEFPHLLSLIDGVQFDTIYHEHYSYLSLVAVERIFAGEGLRVFDVERLPTHGGSLRVHACRKEALRPEHGRVAEVRALESAAHLDGPQGYAGFEARCRAVRDGLLGHLAEAHAMGRRVAAYGAAAKGNTLLNYCGIGNREIEFVVDKNPAKQNTLLPGSRIPVKPVEALRGDPPDEVLILPWNIRAEVLEQMSDLRQQGVRFVIAVPEICVVG